MFECDMPNRIRELESLVAKRNESIKALEGALTQICITRAKREEWIGKRLNEIIALNEALAVKDASHIEYLKHCSRCKRKHGISKK